MGNSLSSKNNSENIIEKKNKNKNKKKNIHYNEEIITIEP